MFIKRIKYIISVHSSLEIRKKAYGKGGQGVDMRIVIFTFSKGAERKDFETSVVSEVWASTKIFLPKDFILFYLLFLPFINLQKKKNENISKHIGKILKSR